MQPKPKRVVLPRRETVRRLQDVQMLGVPSGTFGLRQHEPPRQMGLLTDAACLDTHNPSACQCMPVTSNWC